MEVVIDLRAADIDERRTALRASSKRCKASLKLAAKKDGPSMFRANGCNDPRRPLSVMPPAQSTARARPDQMEPFER
jgi:hypothetical protein